MKLTIRIHTRTICVEQTIIIIIIIANCNENCCCGVWKKVHSVTTMQDNEMEGEMKLLLLLLFTQ
jgi:hypothetical protein